jgi:hypothetical protein
MRIRSIARPFIALIVCAFSVMIGSTPTHAAEVVRVTMTLEEQYQFKTTAEIPPGRHNCAGFLGGPRAGSDGWIFNQPVSGGANVSYAIAFVIDYPADPTYVLLQLSADGVTRLPFPPDGSDAVLPVPDGFSAGLIDAGAGGGWVRTPAGWTLIIGALGVDSEPSDQATFTLSGVCVPATTPTPTASPTATATTATATPTTATPTTAAPTSAGTTSRPASTRPVAHGVLPVTGSPIGALIGTGVAMIVLGVALLWFRRSRNAGPRDVQH